MKTDQVKKVTGKALEQLITALKQGQSATLTRYLGAMARFHRYSFNHVTLIYTQREDASHVAGLRQYERKSWWDEMNAYGSAKAAEKGLKPMWSRP